MKINHETTTTIRISGLNKDIAHQFEKGARIAVIHRAKLSYTVFDEPDEDGNTTFFDHAFYGYGCKANGQIDKRQRRETMVYFWRPVDTWKYLSELIHEMGSLDPVVAQMRDEVEANLARAKEREQEQLARLLGDA